MSDKKPPNDWEAIRADFETGSMSLRELARWYSISDTAIRKKIKTEGWQKKGSQREPVQIAEALPPIRTVLTPENADPKAIVGRGRNLVLRLLDELDAVTTHAGVLEEMICDETEQDESDRRRKAMLKAVELPARANTIKALATAFKTLSEATASAGKKAQAQEEAQSAGEGTGWGDDLGGPAVFN
jgi:hypothetical protein